jgi:hypothetical protein
LNHLNQKNLTGKTVYNYIYLILKIRIQIAIQLSKKQKGVWADDGNGAGCHDLRCLWRSNFHTIVSNNMKVITDLGYINSYYPVKFVHGKKKPRNGELTVEEQLKNKIIAKQRGIIEKYIGYIKIKFDIFLIGARLNY